MKSNNKALINYYARLVQRGTYKMEDVPEALRNYVTEIIANDESLKDEKLENL